MFPRRPRSAREPRNAPDLSAVGGAAFVVSPWNPSDATLTASGWCQAINPTTASLV